MDKREYEVTPEGFWNVLHYSGWDGYDIMERVRKKGWRAESAWGAHGWDLGSWPYVIVFFKGLRVVVYVEGDVEQYDCPDIETRDAIVDDIAFFYWKHADQDWVAGIHAAEYAPEYLRGFYTGERGDEHDASAERQYVSFRTGYLHECAVVFEGNGALRYVQVGRNVYRGTLCTNGTAPLALVTSKGLTPTHYVDVTELDSYGPAC